ncbi:uncharacterized protein [Venturia canescens]|uniref:uncharacterized protein n=1 Tax=Venturia canescens TaxID=32260 RepID=UPI001C9BDEA4|nr:uncharacterized protein LOC122405600 [Venturia canescens]
MIPKKIGFIIVYVCLVSPFAFSLAEENITVSKEDEHLETALTKLVRIFSKPGAFEKVNSILGENAIEESSSCPEGEEGLDCRRSEARRLVDCPHGDCYCYNCAAAGPEMWAPCCRESLRCCSHLAAACRNCDHRSLFPFCSKHFKKCVTQLENDSATESVPRPLTTTEKSH